MHNGQNNEGSKKRKLSQNTKFCGNVGL